MKTTVIISRIFTKSAFTRMVERLYAQKTKKLGDPGTLAWVIGSCFAAMSQDRNTWKRDTFRDLLLHLEAQACYALLRNKFCIEALANIAVFGNKFVREIKTWERETTEVESQMSSLIRYCFARYEMPAFMESVFYYENKIHMLWYIQLGRGESVLDLSAFPVKFTKKMAHAFKNAPDHYEIARAIRWAQAKGYGASDTMAETIAWSSLSQHFDHELFWATVIRFLARHETLPYEEVHEVLFYLTHQFEADKAFSMKGRSWSALFRQAEAWNREYYKKMAALNKKDWESSGIGAFSRTVVTDDETIRFTIVELTNSEALYDEGYEMSHCVAEYEDDCAAGTTAIFSLRKQAARGITTLATVEIHLESRAIVQAKAKYNEAISAEAEAILSDWAKKEKLELDYEECYAGEHQVQLPDPVAERVLAPPARQVAYNMPQGNYRATRNTDLEINWRLVGFVLFLLAKGCALSRM